MDRYLASTLNYLASLLYLVGTMLLHTSYVRDQETGIYWTSPVARKDLVAQVEEHILIR